MDRELGEAKPWKARDFTSEYKVILKKMHEVIPKLILLEEPYARKQHCIDVLSVLCDIRVHDIPALEKRIKELRDEVKEKLRLRKINRSPEKTKELFDNFEKNINQKKQNHD